MLTELILLCIAAFGAGFIDSIVGGGGLLQTPAMLIVLPQYPVATLLGTTKIPSFSGTAFAAYKYARNVQLNWKLLLSISAAAFIGAFAGAYCVSMLRNEMIKPVIFCVLIAVAVYTYTKKDFGLHQQRNISVMRQLVIGSLFGTIIGFYDGLIGPGTGSFLILAFISLLGSDFLHASANAKFVNLATNLAAIIYFAGAGHIMFEFAVPMAVCNLMGSFAGTRLALLKGNRFIRVFFLVVVFGTILRFAYDLFLKS
ncbi:MAG TPA: sulfite exporter TauE/SafE family protein [Sphingobacteriaceae bacterium]